MKYLRTNSLKRLFSLKRRSLEDIVYTDGEGRNSENTKIVQEPKLSPRPSWKCFSFEEISDATNGFSQENLVGRGGYAEVYKGVLCGGEEIAIKRLTKTCRDERKEKDFLTEIGTIGHVCHPNVLSLLGCCTTMGSISSFVSPPEALLLPFFMNLPAMDWKTRYKIAIGTARGLHYLHKGCQRRIIHRDIKSSNILLTADFEPLISDFGLAKWLPSQWTHHSIAPIEGTFGHLAPEYYTHGIVDEKTDVFAFGVFLLEIISGRKPVDNSHQSIHIWAKPILNQGEIEKLVDPRLGETYDATQQKRLGFAASLCIRASSTWRPTMSEVLEVMLEEEMDKERWKIPEEEEQEEFWGYEDLEHECDSSFSNSPQDSTSTRSTMTIID
ncbi:receptor serine/threonine-protein kinase [Salix suchowensis]|nr:receptor serine/threonine-protein kinase [Salix suchowensis]